MGFRGVRFFLNMPHRKVHARVPSCTTKTIHDPPKNHFGTLINELPAFKILQF